MRRQTRSQAHLDKEEEDIELFKAPSKKLKKDEHDEDDEQEENYAKGNQPIGQQRNEDEEKEFIEQFKKQNNLTKGKDHKERVETYRNTFFVSKKDQVISDNEINNAIKTQRTRGRVGLTNLGNTCFLNAALQCLSNLQPLTDYCLQKNEDNELNLQNPLGSGGLVVKAFSNLVREMWTTTGQSVTPEEFLSVVSYCNKLYSSRRQQDSQEFLLYLLDSIHEDLNRVEKKPYVEQKEYFKNLNQKELEKLAADSWGDHLKLNKSVIVDLFQGQLKSTLKCLVCKNIKYSFEPFMYLTIPIPLDAKEEISIKSCLELFLQKEILDGDEKWFCPECKDFRRTEKKIDLWKLPPTLMVCLKRFQYTPRSKKKINTKVDFPIDSFDMGEFIPKTLQKEKPIYHLFSVISHSGTLNFGHYVSYCMNSEDKQWYLFNDSNTRLISEPEKQIPKANAYVLFYQKCTLQLIKRQTLIESVNWPHKV